LSVSSGLALAVWETPSAYSWMYSLVTSPSGRDATVPSG